MDPKEIKTQARNAHTVHTANCDICQHRARWQDGERKRMVLRLNAYQDELSKTAAKLALVTAEKRLIEIERDDALRKDKARDGMQSKIKRQAQAIADLTKKLTDQKPQRVCLKVGETEQHLPGCGHNTKEDKTSE